MTQEPRFSLLRNPEWVYRIIIALGVFGMYFFQSKFVTREEFKAEVGIAQSSLDKGNEKINSIDTLLKIQAARLAILEDHEARIRMLEREARKVVLNVH